MTGLETWSITVEAGADRLALVTRVVGQPPPGLVLVLSGVESAELSSLAVSRRRARVVERQAAALAECI
jgi:hypothetical protein